jgi:hypothetical protein
MAPGKQARVDVFIPISQIPLAYARGSEALILSDGREEAAVK